MKKSVFFAVTAVTMLLASCTIQQRVYQPGLSIEWKGLHQKQTELNVEQAATEQVVTNEVTAAVENVTAPSENVVAPAVTETAVQAVVVEKDQKVSAKQLKQAVKEFKKEVSAIVANESVMASAQTAVSESENAKQPQEDWVYILLIFLVPFGTTISVYLHEGGWNKKVTTNLILTILCGIPGLIHALITIFGK